MFEEKGGGGGTTIFTPQNAVSEFNGWIVRGKYPEKEKKQYTNSTLNEYLLYLTSSQRPTLLSHTMSTSVGEKGRKFLGHHWYLDFKSDDKARIASTS